MFIREKILLKYDLTIPEWYVFGVANYWPKLGLSKQNILNEAAFGSEGDPLGETTLQEARFALQSLYERKYLILKDGLVRPTRKGRKIFLNLRKELFPDY